VYCYVCFGPNVNILSAIEIWRAAGTDAVSAECLYRLFLERFIPNEIVEIVGGKIGDGPAV